MALHWYWKGVYEGPEHSTMNVIHFFSRIISAFSFCLIKLMIRVAALSGSQLSARSTTDREEPRWSRQAVSRASEELHER
jgi:hypothetical protein